MEEDSKIKTEKQREEENNKYYALIKRENRCNAKQRKDQISDKSERKDRNNEQSGIKKNMLTYKRQNSTNEPKRGRSNKHGAKRRMRNWENTYRSRRDQWHA